MTTLPPVVSWDGTIRERTRGEVLRVEGTAARIRREVAEIRAAAEQLAAAGPVEAAVAEFLTVQAVLLERAGATPARADRIRPDDDTAEEPGAYPSAARSALLIARAHQGARR
ncbi:hypothetical protein ACWCWD_29510 [Streptomyces sp. NPDC001493]